MPEQGSAPLDDPEPTSPPEFIMQPPLELASEMQQISEKKSPLSSDAMHPTTTIGCYPARKWKPPERLGL